jgi:hypothetical protein
MTRSPSTGIAAMLLFTRLTLGGTYAGQALRARTMSRRETPASSLGSPLFDITGTVKSQDRGRSGR